MAGLTNSTRNFVPMQQKYDRVVLLVDMDCFYCQVEEKINPDLKGKPVAVVQYNAWRGGGIIAVNYAARANGVTRHMRGDEAKEQCSEIQLVKVPNIRGKADLSKYREAGKEVANVLQKFTTLLERASVDEAYLDITDAVNKRLNEMNVGTFTLKPQELIDTFAVGYERFGDYLKAITMHFSDAYCNDDMLNKMYDANDIPAVRQSDVRLLLGASIASEIRAAVKATTGYECSAGIAHNKIIAKLACGMNKPNKQTIMPLNQIDRLFETLAVGKIKGLGGKFGEEVCERLKIKTLGQMLKFTEAELQKKFDEKNGSWLYYVSRGIDLEAVTPRFYSKSIGCCKKFPGRNNITGLNTLKHWLNELATEIAERLEKDIIENNRKAKQMTVSYIQDIDGEEVPSSRSVVLHSYEQEMLAQRSLEVIKANTKQFFQLGSEAVLNNPIKFLGISVGKFETIDSGQFKLQEMFANQALKKRKLDEQHKNDGFNNQRLDGNQSQDFETCSKPNENEQNIQKGACFPQSPLNKQVVESNARADNEAANIPSTSIPPIKSFFMKALQKTANRTLASDISTLNSANNSLGELQQEETKLKKMEASDGRSSNDCYDSSETKRIKLSEFVPTNTEADGSNYQTQYAEFALPELRLDLLEFQKCELCGAKIPLEERALQTHRDHHFAQELSKQLRTEFRSENSVKLTQQNPKHKSKATSSKTNVTKKPAQQAVVATPDITKFLKPKATSSMNEMYDQSLEHEPTTSTACKVLECQKCKKLIKHDEWTEHLDYHVASDLQRELNKQAVHTVAIARKPTHSKQTQNKNATKPISKFFNQNQSTLEDER